MQYDLTSLMPVMPEIFLLSAACVVLVVDLFLSERTRLLTYGLSLATLIGTIAVTVWSGGGEAQVLFDGSYIRDPMSDLLKVSLLVVTGFAMVYAKDYLVQQEIYRGEYYTLGLFAALGMMIMASAYSFLTVYLGLELLALSMYALVAFDRDSKKGSEAAMKYFVLGAIAWACCFMACPCYTALQARCLSHRLPVRCRQGPLTRPFWYLAWYSLSLAWRSSLVLCRSICGYRMSTMGRQQL